MLASFNAAATNSNATTATVTLLTTAVSAAGDISMTTISYHLFVHL